MSDPVLDHAQDVLAAAREELSRADNKAALLLASAGVVFGALLAAVLAGSWSPNMLDNVVEWLWWTGATSASMGLIALGWAIYPRIRARSPRPAMIGYFGDVIAAPADDLLALLEATAATPMRGVLDQLHQVSHIVHRKYLAIQFALVAFSAGAAACIAAVLVSSALT
ncbi:DUF5706 domain-containing protein [Kribbella sp. NBC_00709]|uniref:Pycsar system effector family protein n=1 Tax=Kribbella sp. NBC_00709 TaxID=2975972 RepID=UPI002E2DE543|nr:Pycsar system effector family protein [Kribbella sp. NBC_00709]